MKRDIGSVFWYNEYSKDRGFCKPLYKMTNDEITWRIKLHYSSTSLTLNFKTTRIKLLEWWINLSEKTKELHRLMKNLDDN